MSLAEPFRRYYVVCAEAIRPHWWVRFLRPGYRHCYLLVFDGAVWLYVDPVMDRTRVAILDYYEPEHPAAWIEDPSARVFETTPEDHGGWRAPWVVGPLTCVEQVKQFLGIRAFWIFTPWQLAQYLRRKKRRNEVKDAEEIARRTRVAHRTNAGAGPAGGPDQRA